MEENQAETKQETAPAQEPKRPWLLSIILIFHITLYPFLFVLVLTSKAFGTIWDFLLTLSFFPFAILFYLDFWRGYKLGRIMTLLILIYEAFIFKPVFGETTVLNMAFFVLIVLFCLYFIFDKKVKAYCKK